MKDLQFLINVLKSQRHEGGAYYIPERWNYVNAAASSSEREGEVSVNPYQYYAACLETILRAPAQKRNRNVKSSVIYSMLPRAFSAWNHTGDEVETGTFLKTTALLPLLIQRGVDTICLLPIFLTGTQSMPGMLPSPYAIQDYMKIEPALHDPRLPEITPEEEFGAFIEACHHLGILVTLEFPFRAAARDNVLIHNHPEWFYWVKAGEADKMKAPLLPGGRQKPEDGEALERLYKTEEMKAYMARFVEAPDRVEWKDVVEEGQFLDEGLVSVAARRLGRETAPAIDDALDGTLPTREDLSYFRMYFDNTPAALRRFPQTHIPFLAQDGVFCREFPGKLPNFGLWRFIESVIPYYQETFGIDGVRLTDAETLPEEIIRTIVKRGREIDEDFLFWSDESDAEKAYDAAEEGYDFISGSLTGDWEKLSSDDFGNRLFQHIDSALPVMAALETPETPRILKLMRTRERVEAAFWISALIPNTILLVHNGMEMGAQEPVERLRAYENDCWNLRAFYSPARFDWLGEETSFCEDLLLASQLRKVHRDALQPENLDLRLLMADTPVIVLKYQTEDKQILAVINRTDHPFRVVPERLIDGEHKVLYSKRAAVDGTVGEYGVLIFGSLRRRVQKKPAGQEPPAPDRTPKPVPESPPVYVSTARQNVPDGILPEFTKQGGTNEKKVAYFSMEFALDAALELYAGEAGILAGDVLKTAKDMNKPMVGVGILWRQGFVHQLVRADGVPIDCYPENHYDHLKDTGVTITLPIRGRKVMLKVWLCDSYGNVPLYLLDSGSAVNGDDRLLTGRLYGGSEEERVAQEMILGFGGVMALKALGIEVDVYHLNGTPAVLAGIRLIEDQVGCGCLFEQAYERTKNRIVFTAQEPVGADGETHSLELLRYMGAFGALSEREMVFLGGNPFHKTVASLRMSYLACGISQKHSARFKDNWSGIPNAASMVSITGGLHIATWMDLSLAEAVQNQRDLSLPHQELKRKLLEEIARRTGQPLREEVLTIGAGRGVSLRHRNNLIFRDFDRLEPLILKGKLQIVLAGKTSPGDLESKRLLTELYRWAARYPGAIVFLQDLDLTLGRLMTRGCDVWLNTTLSPMEACGVSSIKAAMNGVLNLSIRDGWWAEAGEDGVNGWQFGNGYEGEEADDRDSAALADVLLEEVAPLYYKNPEEWQAMMHAGINVAYKQFSSVRMLREYYMKLYKPQGETSAEE